MMGDWTRVTSVDSVRDGSVVGVTVAGRPVALYRVEGNLYATDNICSHAYALLSDGWLDDHEIECPLHAGRFDIRTGAAQGGPVTCGIKTYPVRVVGQIIEVEIDWSPVWRTVS